MRSARKLSFAQELDEPYRDHPEPIGLVAEDLSELTFCVTLAAVEVDNTPSPVVNERPRRRGRVRCRRMRVPETLVWALETHQCPNSSGGDAADSICSQAVRPSLTPCLESREPSPD